jgi:hypothetical protein
MKAFLRRQSVLPFESLIAFLAVVSGGLALLNVGGLSADALSAELHVGWLVTLVQTLYLVSGLALFIGLGLGRRDLEAFGLVTLAAVEVIRSVGLYAFVGFEILVAVSYVFNAAIVLTCAVRLHTLTKGRATIQADHLEVEE